MPNPKHITIADSVMSVMHHVQYSKAPRRKVAAALWRKDKIYTATVNAPPPGAPSCTDRDTPESEPVGCWEIDGHCMRNAHAEDYSLMLAARNGISTNGMYMTVSEQPCIQCARNMAIAGIRKCYYIKHTDHPWAYNEATMFDKVGLHCERVSEEDVRIATEAYRRVSNVRRPDGGGHPSA